MGCIIGKTAEKSTQDTQNSQVSTSTNNVPVHTKPGPVAFPVVPVPKPGTPKPLEKRSTASTRLTLTSTGTTGYRYPRRPTINPSSGAFSHNDITDNAIGLGAASAFDNHNDYGNSYSGGGCSNSYGDYSGGGDSGGGYSGGGDSGGGGCD